MTDQPTPEPEDTCRPVDIDGETIRVRGAGEMSDESRAALGEVVRAAKSKLTAEAPQQVGALQNRLRLAHQARRAKAHQLDDIRRALCDIGFMDDDDPYSHADLADVIRQNGRAVTDGQPVCMHPEGYEGECPCPTDCVCCRVEAALHFHLAPAGLQEQIAASLENFPVACWTSGNITSRIMPLVAAAFDGYREAVANDAGAVRDREHAALKRAHVALAEQAGRDQAAIGRVRALAGEGGELARYISREQLLAVLDLDADEPARTTPDNPATSSDEAGNPLREQLITAVTAEVQSTAGPFGLIPRTVDAALATLEAHLDIGEAEAWCKTCRRVWEGKQHRCESDAEQRLDRVRDALASFDGRGVIAIGHVNLDIPTAGEVIDAVRAALDAPQEQP